MGRASQQRIITLALAVLDRAAYASGTQKVDTLEVRLALAALWCILRDRTWLEKYWQRANHVSPKPWISCREPWYGIAASLREEGWHAPYDTSLHADVLSGSKPPPDVP